MPLSKVVLSVLSLGLALALSPAADAADPDPDSLPRIGDIAPAFGLQPFQAGAAASEGDEGKSSLELDSVCGIRLAANTAAVLVVFIDEDGMGDLQIANSWHRRYKKDGLEIIGVSQVARPAVFGSSIIKARLGFPVLDDRHHIVATRYGIDAAPFSLLLDRECRVVGMSNKSLSLEQDGLGAAIGQMIDAARAKRKQARQAEKRR